MTNWLRAQCCDSNCVEVAFRRSERCDTQTCVEVGLDSGGVVLVRDSKRPEVDPLEFSWEEWRAFVAGLRALDAALTAEFGSQP